MSLNIAQSGFRIAMHGVQNAAHNVANVATPGFRTDIGSVTDPQIIIPQAEQHTAMPSDVNIAEEFVTLTQAQRSFEANVKVVEATSDMQQSLLDATRGPLEF